MKIHAETHHFWCFLRDSRREDFVFGNLPGHLFQIAWRSYDIHHWADFLWLPQCQKSALLPQKHLGHTAPKNEVASYYMLSGWIIILHKPGNYRFWGRVSHEKKHPFRSSVAFDNGGHNSSKCFYCHSSQFQIIHPDVTGHHHNSSLMTSGWCKSNLFIRTYGLDRFMISSSIHPSIHSFIDHSSECTISSRCGSRCLFPCLAGLLARPSQDPPMNAAGQTDSVNSTLKWHGNQAPNIFHKTGRKHVKTFLHCW